MYGLRSFGCVFAIVMVALVGCSTSGGTGSDSGAGPADSGADAAPTGPGASCSKNSDCVLNDGASSDSSGSACVEGGCGCRGPADCALLGVPGLACDTGEATCVQCVTGDDCKSAGLGAACSDGVCHACDTSADCTAAAPICDGWSCLECTTAADCASNADGHHCFPNNACGCETSADCGNGRLCDEGTCVMPCTTNANCTDGYRSVCDTSNGMCVRCLTDDDCVANGSSSGYGSHCFAATKTCGCASDVDCGASDSGHRCDVANGLCSCSSPGDCPAGYPYCRANGCGR